MKTFVFFILNLCKYNLHKNLPATQIISMRVSFENYIHDNNRVTKTIRGMVRWNDLLMDLGFILPWCIYGPC